MTTPDEVVAFADRLGLGRDHPTVRSTVTWAEAEGIVLADIEVPPDRDALVQAVLDALNAEDLRHAASLIRRASYDPARAAKFDAAADALAALREATDAAG